MSSRSDLAAAAVAAVLALAGCSSDDDTTGGAGSSDATRDAWCEQFDAVVSASVDVFEQDLDPADPANDEVLAEVQAEYDALAATEVPEAIRDDWDTAVFLPPTGGVVPDDQQEADAARARVAQWVLDECDPSPAVADAMREDIAMADG